MGRASRIEFCCFGVPLINVGSYTICIEFIFVAACIIALALAPPEIVATVGALPSTFPKIIVAVLGILALLWQFVGLAAIRREAPSMYRTYIRINFLIVLVTIVATLAFFAVAAARHGTALTQCTAAYGAVPAGSSSLSNRALDDLGNKICNIFIWVQVGFMGLLIALIGLTQLYMCAVQRSYGKHMRMAIDDRKTFDGSAGMSEGIPLATRGSGIWESPNTNAAGYHSDLNASVDDGYYGGAYQKQGNVGPQDHSYLSPTMRDSQYGSGALARSGGGDSYETYSGAGSDGFGYRRSLYDAAQQAHAQGHQRGESKQSAYYYAS